LKSFTGSIPIKCRHELDSSFCRLKEMTAYMDQVIALAKEGIRVGVTAPSASLGYFEREINDLSESIRKAEVGPTW